MRHSFLLEPGIWLAEGIFTDAEGVEAAATGRTEIVHAEAVWEIRGRMTVAADPPLSIENQYAVTPMPPGAATTPWRSDNPVLGALKGHFTIVGDTLISLFRSRDGRFRGTEFLIQHKADAGAYDNRGVLLKTGILLSAWRMTLTRDR